MTQVKIRETGIIRRIDDIGRIVIPKELRRKYGISEGQPMEVFVTEDGSFVFKPYATFEQCVRNWYNDKGKEIMNNFHPKYLYYDRYTVCIITKADGQTRYGVAKCHENDLFSSLVGKVAAFARAINTPVDELVGYLGD